MDGDSVFLDSFGPEGSAANPMLRGWQEDSVQVRTRPLQSGGVSSNVNVSHAINLRVLCGASLADWREDSVQRLASPLYPEHSPCYPEHSLDSFGPEGSAANPMLRGWQKERTRPLSSVEVLLFHQTSTFLMQLILLVRALGERGKSHAARMAKGLGAGSNTPPFIRWNTTFCHAVDWAQCGANYADGVRIRCRCEHAPYDPAEYHPFIKR